MDIIEKLKFGCPFKTGTVGEKNAEAAEMIMQDAAIEIERLRREVENLSANANNIAIPNDSPVEANMPWKRLLDSGWKIVGMNHYRIRNVTYLSCAMARSGRSIIAKGPDESKVFLELEQLAETIVTTAPTQKVAWHINNRRKQQQSKTKS